MFFSLKFCSTDITWKVMHNCPIVGLSQVFDHIKIIFFTFQTSRFFYQARSESLMDNPVKAYFINTEKQQCINDNLPDMLINVSKFFPTFVANSFHLEMHHFDVDFKVWFSICCISTLITLDLIRVWQFNSLSQHRNLDN